MNLRSKSYRIARRAGQQGARPSGLDQPEVEKLATESKSSITQSFHGHQARTGEFLTLALETQH